MRRPSSLSFALVLCASTMLLAANARAAEFFVDPAAAAAGDGSAQNPWQTLEQVVAAGAFGKTINAGDTVWLRSGYHGALAIKNGDYTPPITIAAAAGQKPTLSRVSFSATKGWVLAGASISPSYAATPEVGTLVTTDKSSARITVKDCELFSVKDASAWGATEWIDSASSGVSVRGPEVTISNNDITNVRFGISVDGADALIDNNRIVNFSADGLRGLGDNGVFQYNLVKNVYVSGDDGDENHDDGFQSWSVGGDGVGTGVVTGVVLRGNVFVNREDPSQKLTNTLQGIGCFDGMFDGWVVENNVLITDHWHGITFSGMTNSRIVNNTVIDVNDVKPGPPWIKVGPHKNETSSNNVIVCNNLATDYDLAGTAITDDHNTTLTSATLTTFFVSPTAPFDLHLLPDAPAVDTGSAEQAPQMDADRIPRPQGIGIDLGAYEWHTPAVVPIDGGAALDAAGGASGTGGAAGPAGTGGAMATGGTTGRAGIGGAAGSAGDNAGGATTSTGPLAQKKSGCSCGVTSPMTAHGLWALAVLGALLVRRRRRCLDHPGSDHRFAPVMPSSA
ncbi:MAG: right-handed parallel beta-helix repeat-containing protein [Deltaproteobacteria bacterium]|nr:right-handed parallel beta-helix repeat-containing protein [Deltaproteobacteria bacterium]